MQRIGGFSSLNSLEEVRRTMCNQPHTSGNRCSMGMVNGKQ